MKPCSKNRRRIAWLVMDALDDQEATTLRDHLAVCEGCRRYREEFSRTTEQLAAAKPQSNIQASESFHRRMTEKLQVAESHSVVENLVAWLRGTTWNGRLVLPTAAMLVIVIGTMVALWHRPVVSQPPHVVRVASESRSDLAPTIGNYQRAASQSLKKLDELLTEQANQGLPPVPVYTISVFGPAGASF